MPENNKQKLTTIIKNNLFMLGRVAKFTPSYFIWMIIDGLVCGALQSSAAFFSFAILNTVSEGTNFPYALKLIIVMAIFYLVTYGIETYYDYIHRPKIQKKLHLKMHRELFAKAHSLDLSCFDDPEFYNDFVWAMDESDKRAVQVMEDTSSVIIGIVSSVSIFSLLLTIDPVIAAILFVSTLITVICNTKRMKMLFIHRKTVNELWRKKSYINRVYHLADYAKELRVSRANDLLMKQYDDNAQEITDIDLSYGKKYYLLDGLGWNVLGNITLFAVLIYMILMLKDGKLLIGGFAATVSVVWQIRWTLADLTRKITGYVEHSLFIEKYRQFTKLEPKIAGKITDIPPFESLEFKNVSFSYDFNSLPKYKFHRQGDKIPKNNFKNTEALKNINLKIVAGEKIALVGYNGAGKTTLIKLMMRFYDACEGEILYNGVNIKQYDPAAYRKQIGTVFQDYKIFAASIAQNVMNGEFDKNSDTETVLNALHSADFDKKLSELKDGIDTHLTREFNDDGTNLSGGEQQKIAIARVFAAGHPIVIMDEPSSALDPIAEYNLNKSILSSTQDKTVIFISHRLSTTKIADKIYMFDSGELIEEGTHEVLMSQGGKYAEMFKLQSEKYEESYNA